MRIKYKVLIAFILLFLAIAFAVYKNKSKIIKRIVPTIEQLDNNEIIVMNDTAYVSTKLLAINHTFLHIKIDSIKYQVSLFGKVYLQEEYYLGINLRGNQQDTFGFSLKIPIAALVKDLKAQRKVTDSASYEINVVIHYSTFLGEFDFPLNKSSKIKIPQPPQLEVIKVVYDKIRFKYALATVKIKVTNFNDISLEIKSMNYNLQIKDHGDAKGVYTQSVSILPKSESYVDLPIRIEWENLGKTLRDIAKDEDTYDYLLFLNGIIASPDPEQKSISVKIIKTGRMELKKPKNKQ